MSHLAYVPQTRSRKIYSFRIDIQIHSDLPFLIVHLDGRKISTPLERNIMLLPMNRDIVTK